MDIIIHHQCDFNIFRIYSFVWSILKRRKSVIQDGDEVRKFTRPKEAIRIYSMSRHYVEEVAHEAGALYKIGRVTLINVKSFEEYLERCKVI